VGLQSRYRGVQTNADVPTRRSPCGEPCASARRSRREVETHDGSHDGLVSRSVLSSSRVFPTAADDITFGLRRSGRRTIHHARPASRDSRSSSWWDTEAPRTCPIREARTEVSLSRRPRRFTEALDLEVHARSSREARLLRAHGVRAVADGHMRCRTPCLKSVRRAIAAAPLRAAALARPLCRSAPR